MLLKFVFLLSLVGAWAQTTPGNTHRPRQYPDLETALSKKPHYSMLLGLLRSTGLLDQLKQNSAITLFAPTNAALSALPADQFNDLQNYPDKLKNLLQYHVANTDFHPGGKMNDKVLTSLENGLPIRVNAYKMTHTQSAEGINITETVHIDNGYILGLDGVMTPPQGDVVDLINANPNTSTLASLIATAGLNSLIRSDSNITVFAPTNAAFAKLSNEVLHYLQSSPDMLKEVLLYHIVKQTTLYSIGMRHAMTFQTADHNKDNLMLIEDLDGDDIFLNNAKVTTKDLSATNGVVHLIDNVLIPTKILIQIEDQGLHLG